MHGYCLEIELFIVIDRSISTNAWQIVHEQWGSWIYTYTNIPSLLY